MKLVLRGAAHARVVDVCMQSWIDAGATIDIAERLPSLAVSCGLEVEHIAPQARIGRPGSLVWTWLAGFLDSYMPRLVERGLLDEATRQARCVGGRPAAQQQPFGVQAVGRGVGDHVRSPSFPVSGTVARRQRCVAARRSLRHNHPQPLGDRRT
jgi:hypothetical protein